MCETMFNCKKCYPFYCCKSGYCSTNCFLSNRIDVFIPTKNNAKTLEICLKSIKENIPYSTIYAVDAASTDETRAILTRHGVVVVEQGPIKGLGAAREIGLNLVKTPIFLTVDADCIISRGYFRAIYPRLIDPKVSWATGPIIFGSDVRA